MPHSKHTVHTQTQSENADIYLTADDAVRPLVLEVAVLRTLAARRRPVEARHAPGEARAVEAGAGVALT